MINSIANSIIAALAIIMTSLSVGISQGITNNAAVSAMNIQPHAKDDIAKLALLGSALIETASILAVFVSAIVLLDQTEPSNFLYSELAKIGIGFAICSAGFAIGLASSGPAAQACYAVARQPFMAPKIFNFMLITLSVIQTPLIFAFIVALLIKGQAASAASLADSLRLIGSGFAVGIGCVGPAIGLSLFTRTAIRGLGINKNAYNRLLVFTFISQAIIDAPIIFSLLIALTLLLVGAPVNHALMGINFLAAGLCMGLGTFGPGLSSGRIASAACEQITHNPDAYPMISRASIFAQGIVDTMAIYSLLIAILLIFVI